jgi:hypothetical protein
MTVFTYSQARQHFASVLDIASREGEVQIRRKDGSLFSLSLLNSPKRSPLHVRGLKTKATTEDIIAAIRESRTRK